MMPPNPTIAAKPRLIFVRPAPGIAIRDPATRQLLPETGARVADTNYWRRRLAAGDVVAVVPQSKSEA
jgi:hypothetical protein